MTARSMKSRRTASRKSNGVSRFADGLGWAKQSTSEVVDL